MSSVTGNFQSAHPILIGLAVSAAAALVSYFTPDDWSTSLVAGIFFAATYLLCLHGDRPAAPYGLALGGLFESHALSFRRLRNATWRAVLLSLVVLAVIIPPYVVGFRLWFAPTETFSLERSLEGMSLVDLFLGHLLVIALPEEAFFRGYLQTSLQHRWPAQRRLLGAPFGTALLVSSLIFAVGHFATLPHPSRLAVFFPSLLFGWLRNRSGGIGASVLTHASCNVLVHLLLRGYGLT